MAEVLPQAPTRTKYLTQSRSKALRLSYFSMFMAVDYVLGFLPIVGFVLGWFVFPAVGILSGKRYAVLFWLYTFVPTIPSLLGGSIVESQALATPVQTAPVYI